jgi:hypothetical protein
MIRGQNHRGVHGAINAQNDHNARFELTFASGGQQSRKQVTQGAAGLETNFHEGESRTRGVQNPVIKNRTWNSDKAARTRTKMQWRMMHGMNTHTKGTTAQLGFTQ